MSVVNQIRRIWFDFLAAVQFMTRLQVPAGPYEPDMLARLVKFFPVVGALIGLGSALLYFLLVPHLPVTIVAVLIVGYMVAITGCLHEDGLADAADGFGDGGERERVLAIMRDSRIGTYGAVALALTLLARVLLIASSPQSHAAGYLIAAPVLCRWTTLPLSFYLPPARECGGEKVNGQGARIARLTTCSSLIVGSLFALVIVFALLRLNALVPVLLSMAVTLGTGLYYKHRISGITGDCFGATNQLAEVVVYLCGVWA